VDQQQYECGGGERYERDGSWGWDDDDHFKSTWWSKLGCGHARQPDIGGQ
jgi:hypothetical protein